MIVSFFMKISVMNATRRTQLADAMIADTPTLRRKGLLGLRRLGPGDGLWLTNVQSIHTNGMTYPIDVVFIDGSGNVTRTVVGMGPGGSAMSTSAKHTLELPAGVVGRTGTLVGDKVFIL